MTMINLTRRMKKLEVDAPTSQSPVKVVFTRNGEPSPLPVLAIGQRLIVVRFVSPGYLKNKFYGEDNGL
jgi:hypothetical protein